MKLLTIAALGTLLFSTVLCAQFLVLVPVEVPVAAVRDSGHVVYHPAAAGDFHVFVEKPAPTSVTVRTDAFQTSRVLDERGRVSSAMVILKNLSRLPNKRRVKYFDVNGDAITEYVGLNEAGDKVLVYFSGPDITATINLAGFADPHAVAVLNWESPVSGPDWEGF